MRIDTNQLKRIHAAIQLLGLQKNKADLVHSFSNGRCESTKDLTYAEANEMLQHLNVHVQPTEECDKKRKRLIGMAYGIGANSEFVKAWCEKYGVYGVKKKFNQYDSRELSGLIAKFSKVEKHTVEKTLEVAGV